MPVPPEAQTVFQAWLIAIPTVLTAVSTWYLSRKTKTTARKSNESTRKVIEGAADESSKKMNALELRVRELENQIAATRRDIMVTRQSQLESAKKHGDIMSSMKLIMARYLEKNREDAVKPTSGTEPAKEPVTKEVEKPVSKDPTNFGKVIVKP